MPYLKSLIIISLIMNLVKNLFLVAVPLLSLEASSKNIYNCSKACHIYCTEERINCENVVLYID